MGCCEVHSNFFYYCRYAQNKLNKLNQFGSKVGLKINTEKTKVLRLKAARPDLLKIGEKDVYLGAKVNKQGGADSEIKARIWKARTGFHKLKSDGEVAGFLVERLRSTSSRPMWLRFYFIMFMVVRCGG